MNLKYTVLLASGLLVGSAVAYSVTSRPDRRTFVAQSITSATIGAATFLSQPSSTMAATDDEDVVTTTPSDDGFITTESGLRYKVVTVGSGAIPTPGQTVKAHYTGTLSIFIYRIIKRVHCHCYITLQKSNMVFLSFWWHEKGWLDGFDSPKKFDSSRDRGRPFQFAVGKGQVIRVRPSCQMRVCIYVESVCWTDWLVQ